MKRLTHVFLITALLIAALRAVGTRYFNEDLFLGFCSGKDTLNGLLGKPDHWSFNTGGQVWIDNSWLSYLFYYISYLELGDIGPVLVKTLLLVACLLVAYSRSLKLGAGSLSSLLALLMATVSVGHFLWIRGDNFAALYLLLLLTFLTGSPEHRRGAQICAVSVLALWSNGHGSFPYGFFLIVARFGVELLSALGWLSGPDKSNDGTPAARELDVQSEDPEIGAVQPGHQPPDVKGWFLTVLASGVTLAFLNPYGPGRITAPVRRTMAESFITSYSADWLSIPQSLSASGLNAAVMPFLFFLAVLIISLIVAVTFDYSMLRRRIRSVGTSVFVMLPAAAVPITLMAFQYQRLIVLASFTLVPLSAFLLECAFSAIYGRFAGRSRRSEGHFIRGGFAAALSALLVCLLSVHFYYSMVIRYLPGNPFRDDKPLSRRLMSFPAYTMEVCEFMKQNGLSGRVFAGWGIATLAMFSHPGIQVFMDCRDSAIFDDSTMQDFLVVLYGTNPGANKTAASILEEYGVSYVLVTSDDLDFASRLMKTKQWLPAYVDDEAILLMRRENPIAEQFARANGHYDLHFTSPATRAVTESLACLFLNDSIPDELAITLKRLALQRPTPLLYFLLASAQGPNVRCDIDEPSTYLEAELNRLMPLAVEAARGGEIVGSRIRILDLLTIWSRKCQSPDRTQRYVGMKAEQEAVLRKLIDRYY